MKITTIPIFIPTWYPFTFVIKDVTWTPLRSLRYIAVSYTHLDVYKRQVRPRAVCGHCRFLLTPCLLLVPGKIQCCRGDSKNFSVTKSEKFCVFSTVEPVFAYQFSAYLVYHYTPKAGVFLVFFFVFTPYEEITSISK